MDKEMNKNDQTEKNDEDNKLDQRQQPNTKTDNTVPATELSQSKSDLKQNEDSPEKSTTKDQEQQEISKQQKPLQKLEEVSDHEHIVPQNFSKDYFQTQTPIITESSILIQISSSEQKGFALGKHTYHQITGSDKHGLISIKRRTSEFDSLRRILLERWPGCFIPTISDRTDMKTDSMKKLHKRKNLEQFLLKVSKSEFIYYKQEVQLFLRSEGIDIEEMFAQMPILKVNDVTQRLKSSFEEQDLKPSAQSLTKISKFSTGLKKISNNIGNLAKKMLKLGQSYELYSKSLPKIGQILQSYEKLCLTQYTVHSIGESVVLRTEPEMIDKLGCLEKSHNVFYDFYLLLEAQARDADSLLDIISAMQLFRYKRDELDKKSKETRQEIDQVCLGHKNMKMRTSKITKQEMQAQLEERQDSLITEKHLINELSSIAQQILGKFTIEIFKKMKRQQYVNIINLWNNLVGTTNTEIYQIWKFIVEEADANIKRQL